MGCACNKKPNSKYMAEDEVSQLLPLYRSGMEKIGTGIGQFLFGLLISVIIIVGFIPVLAYVAFCLCFGKQPSFRIPNFMKYMKKE